MGSPLAPSFACTVQTRQATFILSTYCIINEHQRALPAHCQRDLQQLRHLFHLERVFYWYLKILILIKGPDLWVFACFSPRMCVPVVPHTACRPQVTHIGHDAKEYLLDRNNPLWVCPYMLTGYPWQPTSRLATSVWYCSPLCTLCDMHYTPWSRDTVTLQQTDQTKV